MCCGAVQEECTCVGLMQAGLVVNAICWRVLSADEVCVMEAFGEQAWMAMHSTHNQH